MSGARLLQKQKGSFNLGWWFTTVFISFVISIGIISIIHVLWHPTITTIGKSIVSHTTGGNASGQPDIPSINRKETILAMGVDSNGKDTDPFSGTRSDVMIVAALDPVNKTISAISIPRDSKVYLADGKGIDKINAAHAYGGPELAVKTVEQTLGIKIDHYVIIDYAGLKEVVRALGGVNVYVEKKMKYTDWTAKLFIDLKPGKQLLDADHAEMYLRFRHDAEADIGRIKRQQWFLKGVLEKIKEPTIIFKLPELIGLANKFTRTDMNAGQMLSLAGFAKDINFNNIQVATLPGGPSNSRGVSYWILDVNQSQNLVDRMILGYDAPVENVSSDGLISLSVVYDPEQKEAATSLLSEIDETKYKIVCKNTLNQSHTRILSHSSIATLENTNKLRENLAGFRDAPVFIAPQEIYCANSDYTIVLGKDK